MALTVLQGLTIRAFPKLCSAATYNLVQVATITSAGGQSRPREYKPFDYRRKRFKFIDQPFDRTARRMDENSKVIVIDGPIASGKNEFAKQLAKQLDFKYIPQPSVKELYKCGRDGLTYQDLDELLSPDLRIYDLETFLSDKKSKVAEGGGRAGWLQVEHFTVRLYAYNDALLHLLSTGNFILQSLTALKNHPAIIEVLCLLIGQGVVCVRSPWSDRVFAKALFENGYISRNGKLDLLRTLL